MSGVRLLPRHVPVIAFAVLFLALLGCDQDGEPLEGVVVEAWPPETVAAIQDAIALDGRAMALESFVNRDFMPICPPGGHRLTAHIRLTEVDSLSLGLDVSRAYVCVIAGEQMWINELTPHDLTDDRPYRLVMYASNGPRWEPGTRVDVVVQYLLSSGAEIRIIERDVEITRSS